MANRLDIFKLKASLRISLLIVSLSIVVSGCDSKILWDIPIVENRHIQVRQEVLNNASIQAGIDAGASWINSSKRNFHLIYGFDATGSKSFGYKCAKNWSDKEVDEKSVNTDFYSSAPPNLVLNCEVRNGRAFVRGMRRVEKDNVVWEYRNSLDSMSIYDFVYVDSEIILANIRRDFDGVSYAFFDAESGNLIKQSEYIHMSSNSGFNRSTMCLYVPRHGMDRTKDSFIMHYDYETNSFTDLAVIPNDFSGQKMTISIQPEMTFGKERYLVLSISSGGRGITFAGFIVIDTRTGEYLYKDYFEGGPPFKFVANDEGDLVVVKYDNDARSSIVTHLHFN